MCGGGAIGGGCGWLLLSFVFLLGGGDFGGGVLMLLMAARYSLSRRLGVGYGRRFARRWRYGCS